MFSAHSSNKRYERFKSGKGIFLHTKTHMKQQDDRRAHVIEGRFTACNDTIYLLYPTAVFRIQDDILYKLGKRDMRQLGYVGMDIAEIRTCPELHWQKMYSNMGKNKMRIVSHNDQTRSVEFTDQQGKHHMLQFSYSPNDV